MWTSNLQATWCAQAPLRVRVNVEDDSVASLPLAGAAQPTPFGCRFVGTSDMSVRKRHDTASSKGHRSKFRQSTKPKTVDLSNGMMSEAVGTVRVGILHRGLLLSVSSPILLRLLASPSRSWAVRVHPANVTNWRPSSDSVLGVPPNARLLQNSPVQHLALCHQTHHFFLTQTWASLSCHGFFAFCLDPFRDSCGAV